MYLQIKLVKNIAKPIFFFFKTEQVFWLPKIIFKNSWI